MESYLTPPNIMFVIGIFGVVFGIYNKIRNPQIIADRREVAISGELKLLQQDIQNLKDNHIHTIEGKVDKIEGNITVLTVKIAELSTIINERIPQRKD